MIQRYNILLLLTVLLVAGFGFAQEQQQINVTVKIIEFQTSKGMETGLSAYFAKRMNPQPYGQVSTGKGIINAASMAFQSSSNAGITLFLDELSNYYGEFELVLQSLVDQNRAFILSQPKVMVPIGAAVPTTISTTQKIPYEKTVAVGSTTVQTTDFKDTGVIVNISALQLYDVDGVPTTSEDTYIQLKLTTTVNEEGQRITVALDDNTSSAGGVFTRTSNAISVPEFISRSIDTTVWVRNGQALILGGLYRNTKQKNLASLPWLTQGENMINNVVNQISPINDTPRIPLASPFGNRSDNESRRELVFIVKADVWRKAFTVTEGFGLESETAAQEGEPEGEEDVIKPKGNTNFLGDFIDSLTNTDEGLGVGGSLGGHDQ